LQRRPRPSECGSHAAVWQRARPAGTRANPCSGISAGRRTPSLSRPYWVPAGDSNPTKTGPEGRWRPTSRYGQRQRTGAAERRRCAGARRFHSRSQPSRHRPTRPTSWRIARQPAMSGRFCWRASTRCCPCCVPEAVARCGSSPLSPRGRLYHRGAGDPGDSRAPGRA